MQKVRPWCGQPSDRGLLKRTQQMYASPPLTSFSTLTVLGGL